MTKPKYYIYPNKQPEDGDLIIYYARGLDCYAGICEFVYKEKQMIYYNYYPSVRFWRYP